uniref:RNase H type-1 domain-containing protein n=1 Tax=Lotus japonicus TaxID=34305 RepID=I3S0H0_LOTJA|nr:unknown [Lotus japonicus]
MCFRWALNLAANWGLDSLVFSSDCQQLVKAFHCPSEFPSLAHIMLDCTQLVNSFRNFSFCFEYRQTNRVAHALAAESHLYKDCEWWGDPPVGILFVENLN